MEWDAVIIAASTVASVLAAIWALKSEAVRFKRGVSERVYLEYTGRYQSILRDLPPGFFRSFDSTAVMQLDDSIKRAVHMYVDLCSEEVKLRIREQVPDLVWNDWEDGIKAGMKHPLVQEVWKEFRLYEDYTVLQTFLAHGIARAKAVYHAQEPGPGLVMPGPSL